MTCDESYRGDHNHKPLDPCAKCGGPKGRGRGRRYCDDCRELARWARQKKYVTRSLLVRQPCQMCGGPKPAGHGHRYCLKCKPPVIPPRLCIDCGTEIKRPNLKCDQCKAQTAERERIRHRQRDRIRHARNAAAGKATHGRDRDRDNETRRIRAREKAEREGRQIAELPVDLYEHRYGDGRGKLASRVDAAPIAALLEGRDVVAVAFRSKVDNSYLYRVIRGEQTTMSLKDADAVCLACDETLSAVFGDVAA